VTTWKQALSILAAFAFGALAVYAVVSWRRPAQPEEWGVVVVHFMGGPSLWGLFESKADCLQARTVYRDVYELMAGDEDAEAKKKPRGSRTLILKSAGERIPITFSCLPLSEIRGLSLTDGGRTSNSN
jgi:hypothetical protein